MERVLTRLMRAGTVLATGLSVTFWASLAVSLRIPPLAFVTSLLACLGYSTSLLM